MTVLMHTHMPESFHFFYQFRIFDSSSDYWTFWEGRVGQFQQTAQRKAAFQCFQGLKSNTNTVIID